MGIVSKDTPLSEIILRKYEKPEMFSGRELIKKLCLSIGLLQPGDSRDVVVDILYVLVATRDNLTSDEINQMVIELRQQEKLAMTGVAASNIRRQLKRLRDIQLVEKVVNTYRITEDEKLQEIFEERIRKFFIEPISTRIKEYFSRADQEFPDPYEKNRG